MTNFLNGGRFVSDQMAVVCEDSRLCFTLNVICKKILIIIAYVMRFDFLCW